MAGVNGVEIKVGQVWRTRSGEVVTVSKHDTCDTQGLPWQIGCYWYGNDGVAGGLEGDDDLIELVKDENGFTIWRGGEQPPETVGRFVTFATNEFEGWTREADLIHWAHNGSRGDIVAYKVVEQAADSATLAEETLSALGWTFDGQAWVEQPTIGMVPNALDVQVGGSHYKDCAIQPIEYIHANKLGFAEGNVVKYITRHRQKHGADDVKKVIHYCQLLLELEYGADATSEKPHG